MQQEVYSHWHNNFVYVIASRDKSTKNTSNDVNNIKLFQVASSEVVDVKPCGSKRNFSEVIVYIPRSYFR